MSHVILTRYNLGLYELWETLKREHKWNHDIERYWQARLLLCVEYTYVSLKKQSNKNFEWWILIDKNTPSHHLDDLYRNFADDWIKFVTLDEIAILPPIVTRMDNDDLLSCNFIKSVQQIVINFDESTPYIIEPHCELRFAQDRNKSKIARPSRTRKHKKHLTYVNSIFTVVNNDGIDLLNEKTRRHLLEHISTLIIDTNSASGKVVHDCNMYYDQHTLPDVNDKFLQLYRKWFDG